MPLVTLPWERHEIMKYLICISLTLLLAPTVVAQGARDRNLTHKRLRMDVTTTTAPDPLHSGADYRSQNLALEKSEREMARAAAPRNKQLAAEKYGTEKERPARDAAASEQMPARPSSLKLRSGVSNYQSRGRHKGWVNGNGR
jgi:hypothetical protein